MPADKLIGPLFFPSRLYRPETDESVYAYSNQPVTHFLKMKIIGNLRKTSHDKFGGVLRILLGAVFFMAGILKVVVPSLGQAFSGQLVAANIPLPGIVLFTFPILEMLLGVLLLVGLHARTVAAVAGASMLVATYVHVVVEDPDLFPLQPVEPIGPLLLIVMLLYIIARGAGAWSFDLTDITNS